MDANPVRKDMPQRLLRLLSLLQGGRAWSGAELADRLGVSARTLRRDVDRLRSLHYEVEGTTGVAGGYRLAPGRDVPPLLLDDEEAVAIGLGLVTVAGVEESALRALAKLRRALPARLRPRLAAVEGTTTAVRGPEASTVNPRNVAALGDACRGRVVVDFDYRDRRGGAAERRVEPHHLVAHGGHWYLIAYDTARDDWRSFRADRISGLRATLRRFVPREMPAPDPATFLTRRFAAATYLHTVSLEVDLSAEEVRKRVYGPFPGVVEAVEEGVCRVRLSADSLDLVCQYTAVVAALGARFTLDAPPEVRERLRTAAGFLAEDTAGPPHAVGRSGTGSDPEAVGPSGAAGARGSARPRGSASGGGNVSGGTTRSMP
ncbi:YafY family protein [Nocardiopsis sp. YSL2]|uniref:helix-turn-helix transcriptional regulator n=1 Tax=Nocardiopsis sp. YSL2 TaxID=2939492 RepID=UPI0026F47ADF|nr:YafY family protein [Nocardiopsis sp. YSL2]